MSFGVADKLVKIQRNFLWGWGAKGRKIVWPLGIRFVSLMNSGIWASLI